MRRELDRIAAAIGPEDVATIVYTSGTTGPPKGCITTHANLMRTVKMYEQQIDLGPGSVVFMFLPLAHLLARVTQMVVLDFGGTLAYWRGDANRLLDDLRAVRPTHVPTVPRVLEKIHTAALSGAEESGRLRGALLHRALATGRRIRTLRRQGRRSRLAHSLASRRGRQARSIEGPRSVRQRPRARC